MSELTRDELLDIIAKLRPSTVRYRDYGTWAGHFEVTMHTPYLRTADWDRLNDALKERRRARYA